MPNENAAMINMVKAINYSLERKRRKKGRQEEKRTATLMTANPFASKPPKKLTMADMVGEVVARASKS